MAEYYTYYNIRYFVINEEGKISETKCVKDCGDISTFGQLIEKMSMGNDRLKLHHCKENENFEEGILIEDKYLSLPILKFFNRFGIKVKKSIFNEKVQYSVFLKCRTRGGNILFFSEEFVVNVKPAK